MCLRERTSSCYWIWWSVGEEGSNRHWGRLEFSAEHLAECRTKLSLREQSSVETARSSDYNTGWLREGWGSQAPGKQKSMASFDLGSYYKILQKLVLRLSQTWRFKSVNNVLNAGDPIPAIFKVTRGSGLYCNTIFLIVLWEFGTVCDPSPHPLNGPPHLTSRSSFSFAETVPHQSSFLSLQGLWGE